ncbi:prephenate dehydrogenase/arogenate dehydrogenase family protein [Microbispora sp. CSR-4]|uniref:prephenate dehydrogenase/arogenate dehydrogenase family protein n=1 Tax=Microbispora sp. CSR-4 TaxID=2592813 RepID=UPI0011CB1F46|nr:prephenate dehydrogenase/arogenate dehydrogenase family protein [Microbispora sp. CSR-4]
MTRGDHTTTDHGDRRTADHGDTDLLRRCVVVGGAGAVGGLFAGHLLRSGAEVLVVDPAPGAATGEGATRSAPAVNVASQESTAGAPPAGEARVLRGDITDIGLELAEELGRADLVLLAVPEQVALAAVKQVAAAMRPGALLADTLSVKGPIADEILAHAGNVEAAGLNPMFAPSLGFAGRPVAAVVVHDGPRTRALLRLVESWGGRAVRLGAHEHDRLAAATQALTHAAVLSFGLALAGLGVRVAELAAVAPPPHATMLALLARIASGTPEVYWDVQSANPQAAAARAALADGVRTLAGLLDGHADGEAEFAAALGGLRDLLGPDLGFYRDTCAGMFGALPTYEPPYQPGPTTSTSSPVTTER